MENILSKEIEQKEAEYEEYIYNHIGNVKKAWGLMKSSKGCMDIIRDAIRRRNIPCSFTSLNAVTHMTDLCIDTHDQSKFSIKEWEPYRKNFHPVNDKEKEEGKADFDKAWIHHYTVNTHHWNHWYAIKKDVDAMDLISVIELCCDWIAMNMVFSGTAIDFYNNRVVNCKDPKEQIYLGKEQSNFIYNIFVAYYNSYPKNE